MLEGYSGLFSAEFRGRISESARSGHASGLELVC